MGATVIGGDYRGDRLPEPWLVEEGGAAVLGEPLGSFALVRI